LKGGFCIKKQQEHITRGLFPQSNSKKEGFKMKFKKLITLASASLVAVFIMAACGGGAADPTTAPQGGGGATTTPAVTAPTTPTFTEPYRYVGMDPFRFLEEASAQFGIRTNNPNPIIPGGELRWAISSSSPFPGLWCPVHFISSLDGDVRWFFNDVLFTAGWDLLISNEGGAATAHLDREARTVTINLRVDNWYWHDGVQVTLNDLLFAYEIIAHPDYTGPRWGASIANVIGALEYRAGEVDYISGLVLSDDHMTLTLHLVNVTPVTMAFGFWTTPLARHQWEPVLADPNFHISEMAAHAFARHETLGNGAWIIDSQVPGESVRFIANDNHWRGRPILDAIRIEIVEPMMTPMAMQSGMYDISGFPQSQFTTDFRYMTNVTFMSAPFHGNSGFWMTFRMGTFDAETMEVYTFENPRLSPVVRTAMALSVDHMGAGQLFNGLVVPTGSIYFGLRRIDWINRDIPTHNQFDPELAMRMLDEAGYVDSTGDGFRDFPDGSPMVITHLAATGSAANELNRHLEIQNWHDIGLNVVFYQGRLVEGPVATAVRAQETDGGVVDSFTTGWNFGANPDPSGIWGPQTTNNHPRFRSDGWQYHFDRFTSDEMWNEAFLRETVDSWQWEVYRSQILFPTTVAISLTAVNNRVTNYSFEITGDHSVISSGTHWWIGLTRAEPYVDGE
jgi:peptide/nickel transport system substrate-binding protein